MKVGKCMFLLNFLQDPTLKPREVHRGLDGLPEIPDGKNWKEHHLPYARKIYFSLVCKERYKCFVPNTLSSSYLIVLSNINLK